MPRFAIETAIEAAPAVCFALLRDVRLNESIRCSDPAPVLGQQITFSSTFLGIPQVLVVAAVEVERPRRCVDAMVSGVFESFVHVHEFEPDGRETLLRDVVIWEMPYGLLGRVADILIIKRHIRKTLAERNRRLKALVRTSALEDISQP